MMDEKQQPTTTTKRQRGDPFLRGRVYWIRYCLRGKIFRESTKISNFAKAKNFRKDRLDELGADRTGARKFAGPKQEKVTVNEILDLMVKEYKRNRKTGIPRAVSPQMQSHLNRVRGFFGLMRAMEVNEGHCDAFSDKAKAEGKQQATINRGLQLLSRAYKVACQKRVLSQPLTISMVPEDNVRKGKFTNAEAEAVFASLPAYMSPVARFAYETGTRSGEIRKLKWSYLEGDAIRVPGVDTKNGEPRSIALTPELEEIVNHQRAHKITSCDLIFHRQGRPIADYRKAWYTACVLNGLGHFYCRDCREVLDAKKTCSKCHKKWERPKYIGRIFHDFRRTACHEMWKAGNTKEDCMTVSGHRSQALFDRYADLFSEEEKQARQREVQQRRREWRETQLANVPVVSAGVQ
jgi:integrase